MSGDSPSSHATETIFDFKEGRHSPIPTTSKEQTNPHNFVTASVLVEQPPKKDEEKEQTDDACLLNSPILNNTGSNVHDDVGNEDKSLQLNDVGNCDEKKKKLNGPDMFDGKWIPAPQQDVKNDKEEEECAVKCLYYTMQCCECTIL